jgi:hypothetical protein
MKIFEQLKGVLSPEDLASFKEEVETAIKSQVSEKTAREMKILEDKAEEYVNLKLEAKVSELEVKAEQYSSIKIDEAKAELVKEYDERLEELESTVVESLDRFLDHEISDRISPDLLEDVAIHKSLLPLAEGLKGLLEQHYIAADTDGSAQVAKLKEEKKSLEEKLSAEIAEKIELSSLAEKAAADLLVREKTEDLSIGEVKKVVSFFEGKSFDEISKKIDGYIKLLEEDTETTKTYTRLDEASDDKGIKEKEPAVSDAANDLLTLANGFM